MSFLSIHNAHIYRNNELIFENLNWEINSNEHWIISGNNASGKSSLSEVLSGKHFARKGQISYPFLEEAINEGHSIYTLKREQIYRVSFADHHRKFNTQNHYYQQRFNAFDNEGISVEEYLEKFGFLKDSNEHQQLVEQVGIKDLLPMSRIKLSSGQVRKLLIVSAIIKAPKLLLIDNPYIGLDAASRVQFNRLLDYLAEEKGMKIILSGHFQELPNCISHRIHLDQFEVVWKGPIKEFPEDIDKPPLNIVSEPLAQLKSYYANPEWGGAYQSMVNLSNINIKYEEKSILSDFNWEVRQGGKWALVGPNGSGKSTILGLLFGDHPQVYANQVYLFDKTRKENGSIWDIKKKMGFVSPELHFFFGYNFNCFKIALSGFQDAFFLLRKPKEEEEKITLQFFNYFGVEYLLERQFKLISTGEQRLTLLIRALVKNPSFLLLDEPFQGLDLQTVLRAKHLLNEILGPQHSLVFITHFKDEIPACVDQQLSLSPNLI